MENNNNPLTAQLGQKWVPIATQYELKKPKGQGSFGQVVAATHKDTGTPVAIKLVDLDAGNFYAVKKLLREIASLRQLSSMGPAAKLVSKIYDVILPEAEAVAENSHIFIVMDLMNCDLKQMMKNAKKLEFDEPHLVQVLYQSLCALNFVHSAGLLHRDIKPQNILIDSECNVKLCDFGLARSGVIDKAPLQDGESEKKRARQLLKEKDARQQRPRRLSNHVVSRWYRPPEVILLEKEYDTSVDVWSMGCVASELIACTKPYRKSGVTLESRFLFTGNMCYPLSPRDDGEEEDDDQLKVILQTVGGVKAADLSFITEDQALNYACDSVDEEMPRIDFEQEYDLISSGVPALLNKMIRLNPHFRATPKELLAWPLFDEVRDEQLEQDATEKVSLPFDTKFDYNACEPEGISLEELLGLLAAEVKMIKANSLLQ